MKFFIIVCVTIPLLASAYGGAAEKDKKTTNAVDGNATDADDALTPIVQLSSKIIKESGAVISGLLKSGAKNIKMEELTQLTSRWEDVKQEGMVGVMKDFGGSLKEMHTLGTMIEQFSIKLADSVQSLMANNNN